MIFVNGQELGETNPIPQPTITTPQALAVTAIP
jgi:hypothetical protein